MPNLSNIKRNPLAANTEPTDEELSVVMSEALSVALVRKQESDNWMRRKLAEAVHDAQARDVAVSAT